MHQKPEENNEEDKIKKHYFQIDVNSLSSSESFSEWLGKILSDIDFMNVIPGFPVVSLPMTDLDPIYGGSIFINTPLYLGNNQYNEPVFKNKHFLVDSLKNQYVNHLRSHAGHFVRQPVYYKGMFDILN